jgi:hypothetical protein
MGRTKPDHCLLEDVGYSCCEFGIQNLRLQKLPFPWLCHSVPVLGVFYAPTKTPNQQRRRSRDQFIG